mmetsp:Transcript_12291/g.43467  ORF Transcript_12291/g.43467 Transcript_12291/m.43467 type:complete len:411 (+) Transcript_12291:77-1309(+)
MKAASLLALAAGAAAKQLVDTAHPSLKAAFAKNGELTYADMEAAAAAVKGSGGSHKAVTRPGVASRLGFLNTTIGSTKCDRFTTEEFCYQGWTPEASPPNPLKPGRCTSCGYFDGKEAQELARKQPTAFSDCLACEEGYELIVLYDDCTGMCAGRDVDILNVTLDDNSTFTFTALNFMELAGFGNLETSACTAYANCYEESVGIYDFSTNGTNDQYGFGESYSYSYSYSYPFSYSYSYDNFTYYNISAPLEEGTSSVEGSVSLSGITLKQASNHADVILKAISTVAGVSEKQIKDISFNLETRRRLAAGDIKADYTIVIPASSASTVAAKLAAATPSEMTTAITAAAASSTSDATLFSTVAVTTVAAPMTTEAPGATLVPTAANMLTGDGVEALKVGWAAVFAALVAFAL